MSDNVQTFSNFADFYQQSTRVTAAIADYGLTLLQPPLTADSIIHDNACGPGVVSFVIADRFAASEDSASHTIPRIYGTDLAPGMLTAMDSEIQSRGGGWAGRISTKLLDARDLRDFEDGKFTHSITNFGIMVDEDGANIAAEIYRTLKPDCGVALVTTWGAQRRGTHGCGLWADTAGKGASTDHGAGVEDQGETC
jgi:ubiquinone/menaquinone biosynthesis C-methylase UbiE